MRVWNLKNIPFPEVFFFYANINLVGTNNGELAAVQMLEQAGR